MKNVQHWQGSRQLDLLMKHKEELQSILEDMQTQVKLGEATKGELVLFDTKSCHYNTATKKCTYDLFNLDVSTAKISSVIQVVLHLTGHKAKKRPSQSTVLEINLQQLGLAQQQLGKTFAKEQDTTLLTDETSKFGNIYMGFEATNKKKLVVFLNFSCKIDLKNYVYF